jgi:hypothetical protein
MIDDKNYVHRHWFQQIMLKRGADSTSKIWELRDGGSFGELAPPTRR